MGKADYVPQVLEKLGVKLVFHKISQRPGKPMWFGIGPDKQVVFALPGNPVSTLVCCRQYVLPALLMASGREPNSPETARLTEDVTFEADLTCFLPVRISVSDDGIINATPAPTNTLSPSVGHRLSVLVPNVACEITVTFSPTAAATSTHPTG